MAGTSEPYLQLEAEFAKWNGNRYAVSCNTGTAAIHLALRSLNIGKGDEVIVPEFSMIAAAFAVSYCGATPVFVDCGDDLNIDVSKIEGKITTRTRCIVPVHIYGRPCDMPRIMEIAKRHSLKVVEDCAEAHGAHILGKKVGTFGDIGCFSFYRNKIVHAEEGGICVTEDQALYGRMRLLKNMAFNESHDYIHSELAYNYRMTNGQAKLALDSLRKVEASLNRRKMIASLYDKGLKQYTKPRPYGSVVWVYDFYPPERDDVLYKVASRRFFRPMSEQPMYRGRFNHLKAYDAGQRGVYLPVDVPQKEAEGILKQVLEIVHKDATPKAG